jgi:hypothetical protein
MIRSPKCGLVVTNHGWVDRSVITSPLGRRRSWRPTAADFRVQRRPAAAGRDMAPSSFRIFLVLSSIYHLETRSVCSFIGQDSMLNLITLMSNGNKGIPSDCQGRLLRIRQPKFCRLLMKSDDEQAGDPVDSQSNIKTDFKYRTPGIVRKQERSSSRDRRLLLRSKAKISVAPLADSAPRLASVRVVLLSTKFPVTIGMTARACACFEVRLPIRTQTKFYGKSMRSLRSRRWAS